MRFKNFLTEEYFAMTADDYTIFINPSQKEKTETIQVSKEDGYGGRIRGLIDRQGDHDIYIFPAGLLHDRACKKIDKSKSKKYYDYYYPIMGAWYEGRFHFIIFHSDDMDRDEQESHKILKAKGWNPVIGFEGLPDSLFEEYYTRLETSEIFKNPSKKEIRDLYNQFQAMRALVDFDNNVIFLFESDLLHQVASKAIAKEYQDRGIFHCLEVYLHRNTLRISEKGDAFKIAGGYSRYIGEPKEPERSSIEWFKDKFKFLGEIIEDES